jgi:ankyrin repeat protein
MVKSRRTTTIMEETESRNDGSPVHKVTINENRDIEKHRAKQSYTSVESENNQSDTTPKARGRASDPRPRFARKDIPHLPTKNHIPMAQGKNATQKKSTRKKEQRDISTIYDKNRQMQENNRTKTSQISSQVVRKLTTKTLAPSKHSVLYEMFEEMEKSSWVKLHQRIEYLKSSEKLRAETVSALQDNHMNLFHTASWKAPPKLACEFFDLLKPHEYGLLMTTDKNGNTPLHLCCGNLLPHKINSNGELACDLSVLQILLKRAPHSLDSQNNEGDTPLHLYLSSPLAARESLLGLNQELDEDVMEGLEEIIQKVPFDDFYLLRDYTGATPLHIAISNNVCEQAIVRLIEANPTACKKEDQQGLTPLHYAAAFMNTTPAVVEKITKFYKYAICHKTKAGDTPLHVAVRNFRESKLTYAEKEIFNMLMGTSKRIRSTETFDTDYYPHLISNVEKLTPLHVCALFDAPVDLIEHLITHPSAVKAQMVRNGFGSTPLHIAAAHPKVRVDMLKVVASMNSTTALDNKSQTPLHVCVQNRHATSAIIKCLIDINPLACNKGNDEGYLPIHLALKSKSHMDILNPLIDAFPVGLEKLTHNGDSALHIALENNSNESVIRLILDKCPTLIFKPNHLGNLPLHCALLSDKKGCSEDIIQLLLKLWPQSPSFQNKMGDSPLHYGVKYMNSLKIVELLLHGNHGTLFLLNNDGLSPLDVAKGNDAPFEVFDLLQNAASKWKQQALNDGWSGFVDRGEM